jgi:predicted component of type VI protein secretion system
MQEDWNIILSVVESPDKSLIGQQKVFASSPISIGRGEENDLPISDPSISRVHATIRITNDYTRVFITDMSTYGTEVSGKKVPKGPGSGFTLNDGDTLKLGNTVLRYELKLKMSVQSTFVGQMDRGFLDEKPAQEEIIEEPLKAPAPVASPAPVEKTGGVSPAFIAIIAICLLAILYLIIF